MALLAHVCHNANTMPCVPHVHHVLFLFAPTGDMVENPPVNPLVGPNRTAHTIRKELIAFQRTQVELAHLRGHLMPVYRASYMFVEVTTATSGQLEVVLGRVSHAPYGGATEPTDQVDVTEYMHTAQPGVSGFFGTFEPTPNPAFDRTNKKMGLACIRHRDVSRSQILVCPVEADGPAKKLVVSLASLKKLA